MGKTREYFLRWKKEAERQETVEFNETEGKIKVHRDSLYRKTKALKELAEKEGF